MNEFKIHPVHSIDIRLGAFDWPFLHEGRKEIDAFWADLSARKPQVYDGRVLLMHNHVWRDGHFEGHAFETAYSAFMAWKKLGFLGEHVTNFFSMAALRASDGAFLLGEMAPWTANAGQSYFPAGTPEPKDCEGTIVNLTSSVLRECAEETGLAAYEMHDTGAWTAIVMGHQIALMRDIRVPLAADQARALIEARMDAQEKPELSRIHIVRKASDAHGLIMPDFMQPFLDHALS